jgi:hypothetical protein
MSEFKLIPFKARNLADGEMKAIQYVRLNKRAVDHVINKMNKAVQAYITESEKVENKSAASMHSFTDIDAGQILGQFDQNKLNQMIGDRFWRDLKTTLRPMKLIEAFNKMKTGTSPVVFRAIKAILPREVLGDVLSDIGITTAQFDGICDYAKPGFYPCDLELMFYFSILRKAGIENGLNAIIKTGKALGNPSVLGEDVVKYLKSMDLYQNLQGLFVLAQNIHAIKDCFPIAILEKPQDNITAVALAVKPNSELINEMVTRIVNMGLSENSTVILQGQVRTQEITSIVTEFFRVMGACLGINAMSGTNKLIRISKGSDNIEPASMMTQPIKLRRNAEDTNFFITIFQRSPGSKAIEKLSTQIAYEVNDITDGDRVDVLELDRTYFDKTVANDDEEAVLVLKQGLFEKRTNKKVILDKTLYLLKANGWNASAISVISGPYLSSHQIMENQYGVVKEVAQRGAAALSAQAKERFKNHYGVSVERVRNNILGGFQFMEKEDVPYQDLNTYWYSDEGEFIELAREMYVKKVSYKGEDLYLLNGFAPELFMNFTKRDSKIVVMHITKERPNAIPLYEMKENLIGTTNPMTAKPQTLRRWLYENSSDLGLSRVDSGWNGYYLSDNYMESIRMLNAYFDIPVENTITGRLLLKQGTETEDLKRLLTNPSIMLSKKEASVFEHTEGMTYDQLFDFINTTFRTDAGNIIINNIISIGEKKIVIRASRMDIKNMPIYMFYNPKMSGWSRFTQYETKLSWGAKSALALSGKHNNLQTVLEKIYSYQETKHLSPVEYDYVDMVNKIRKGQSGFVGWLRNEFLKYLILGPSLTSLVFGAKMGFTFGLWNSIFIGAGLVVSVFSLDWSIKRRALKTGDFYDALLNISGKKTLFNKA